MKLLLLGKSGQVGKELQRSLSVLGHLVALGHADQPDTGSCGDLLKPEELAATVHKIRPDVIVNAAAYTAVDKAETESNVAHAINTVAPGVLARVSKDIGALLVHYSTDYVFDGSGTAPWHETSTPRPLNVYGKTKLDGERLIVANTSKHLIFRTSWVYSCHGNNFPKTILRLAKERENLTVVDDQRGAPTGADLIADVTAHAIRDTMLNPDKCGIYHLASAGETSWFDYALFLIESALSLQPDLVLATKKVLPIHASERITPAQRPLNSRLDTSLLRQTFDIHLPPWQQGVFNVLGRLLMSSEKSV